MKIEFLTIFGKVAAKIRAFGRTSFFYANFFLSGAGVPNAPPLLLAAPMLVCT